MNRSAAYAGWPFAWFLHWGGTPYDKELEGAVVTENDRRGRLEVRMPDGAASVIDLDGTTPVFGVDGYPLPLGRLRIGDLVAVVQEWRDSAFATTAIHLLRRT